jgi:hypothetical protein
MPVPATSEDTQNAMAMATNSSISVKALGRAFIARVNPQKPEYYPVSNPVPLHLSFRQITLLPFNIQFIKTCKYANPRLSK